MQILEDLLADPEAVEHDHVYDPSGSRRLSLAIATPSKLEDLHNYSDAEQALLKGEWSWS
jgi:hypothetical protein